MKAPFSSLNDSNGTVTLTVGNAAAGNMAIIYVGTSATLNVILNNATGSDISLPQGCTLEIYMPSYFNTGEIAAMNITSVSQSGWKFSYSSADQSLLLTWNNSFPGTWAQYSNLTFSILNVLSNAQPGSDSLQINFNGLQGSSIPSQVSEVVFLNTPVAPGNVNLDTVLSVGLQNEGTVFVSAASNPLTNTLYLNFKNTGVNPLYNGAAMWSGNPTVTVTFVYGNTSGALAPDTKSQSPVVGSAWNISGSVFVDETAGWTISNPSVHGQTTSPSWILQPVSTNKQVIGTLANANVSFAFSNVVSLTPPGATQMYVQFSGFRKDENTLYNDEVFVLNLTKQQPPASGAIAIWSTVDKILVSGSAEQITVPLAWSMFNVGGVDLSFTLPGISLPDQTYSYSNSHPALNYDAKNLVFSGLTESQNLLVMCSAYADPGRTIFLNKVQWTVPIVFQPTITSFSASLIVGLSGPEVQLTWTTEGATSVQGSWSTQVLAPNPSVPATLPLNTETPLVKTFTLTAENSVGVTSEVATLTTTWGTIAQTVTLENPAGACVSPNGQYIFVAYDLQLIAVYDAGTMQMLHGIDLGRGACNPAVSLDSRYLFVPNYMGATVYVVDTTSMTLVQSIYTTGNPGMVTIGPDGKHVYTCNDNSTISVIDITQTPMTVVNTLSPGVTTSGLVIAPDSSRAYLFSAPQIIAMKRFVSVIDLSDGTLSGPQIPVGNLPICMTGTPDGKYLFVVNENDNTVTVIDSSQSQLALATTINFPATYGSIVQCSQDGSFLFVICSGVTCVIDCSTLTVLPQPFSIGYNSEGTAVTPDGAYLIVSCLASGVIQKFQPAFTSNITTT